MLVLYARVITIAQGDIVLKVLLLTFGEPLFPCGIEMSIHKIHLKAIWS